MKFLSISSSETDGFMCSISHKTLEAVRCQSLVGDKSVRLKTVDFLSRAQKLTQFYVHMLPSGDALEKYLLTEIFRLRVPLSVIVVSTKNSFLTRLYEGNMLDDQNGCVRFLIQ